MSELVSMPSKEGTYAGHAVRARGRPLVRALVVLGLLGTAAGVVLALRWDQPTARFATTSYENTAGGYAFRYPPSWTVERTRRTTKLLSKDRSVAVSFGLGASTDLAAASKALVDEIRRGYTAVSILGTEEQLIGGTPAIQVFGTGKNDNGVSVRFVAVSIQGPAGRPAFAITAFTAAGADPDRVVPTLNEIVGSFTTI
jgi:hypothetical protein